MFFGFLIEKRLREDRELRRRSLSVGSSFVGFCWAGGVVF